MKFVTGLMNSGKTAKLIKMAKMEAPRKMTVFSTIDPIDRSGIAGVLQSRNGSTCRDVQVFSMDALTRLIDDVDLILIDEAQFLKARDVVAMAKMDKDIVCFGLRMDFNGKLFEGSEQLLLWSSDVEILPSMACKFCVKRANLNVKAAGDCDDDIHATYIPICLNCK